MPTVTSANSTTADAILDSLRESLKREQEEKKKGDVLGKDDFMKLLITQLKHQDPTSPLDNSQFIVQQAQFSSLEQMQNMNANLEALAATMTADRSAYAVSYLGTTVTLLDPGSESGTASGQVTEIRYKDGAPMLVVGEREWALSSVASVKY